MAVVAWRFQCDPAPDDEDPMVTVFLGDSVVLEEGEEPTIIQSVENPAMVPLSELAAFLAAPVKPPKPEPPTP